MLISLLSVNFLSSWYWHLLICLFKYISYMCITYIGHLKIKCSQSYAIHRNYLHIPLKKHWKCLNLIFLPDSSELFFWPLGRCWVHGSLSMFSKMLVFMQKPRFYQCNKYCHLVVLRRQIHLQENIYKCSIQNNHIFSTVLLCKNDIPLKIKECLVQPDMQVRIT